MDTLYDLLGALPRDDAEDLRVAFRRAVKGTHPDLRPDDPEAALKFRQIVRANGILGDPEQRAAYDHLLKLARVEQRSASAHPIAARIHRLATGVFALAVFSIATVVGYLLFVHLSTALVAHANNVDGATRLSASIEAVSAADSPGQLDEGTLIAKHRPSARAEVILASAAMPLIDVESIPAPDAGAPLDLVPNNAGTFRARGISAYRNGDLNGAITDLDHAIQLDPRSSASYIDRGIVFFRLRKFDRAFADIAQAKRIEKGGGPKLSTPAVAGKPRLAQASIPPVGTPKFGPQTPAQSPPPPKRLTAAFLQKREEVPVQFCRVAAYCLPPN
jgi:tetratricopeptide (TPR) repeat protein